MSTGPAKYKCNVECFSKSAPFKYKNLVQMGMRENERELESFRAFFSASAYDIPHWMCMQAIECSVYKRKNKSVRKMLTDEE